MNKARYLIAGFFILILVMLPLAIYKGSQLPPSSKPTIVSSSPTPPVPDKAFISFLPETLYTSAGQINEVGIQINSQGKYPTLIQLEIAYDPEILTQVDLTPDTFFPKPKILLSNNDEETGRLSYALSLPLDDRHLGSSRSKDSSGVAGWSEAETMTPPRWPEQVGIVAKLKFIIKKNTAANQTVIYFLPKTAILSQSTNTLLQTSNALKIYITSPTINASASSRPR